MSQPISDKPTHKVDATGESEDLSFIKDGLCYQGLSLSQLLCYSSSIEAPKPDE